MPSSLLEAVSSGPKTRKLVMLRFMTSRRKLASVAVGETYVLRGPFDVDGVVAEVRQVERLAQEAAVGVRIGGDAAVARRVRAPGARGSSVPFSSKSSSGL